MSEIQDLQGRVARALLEIDAVGFSPEKPVTFKSGMLSPVYVDNRKLPFHPKTWKVIIDGFRVIMRELDMEFDAIAGIEAAGIPHSAALGYALEIPSLFVRKAPKEHGKNKRVEGGDVTDKHVLLIEDLVTTGGSSLDGVAALRSEGATVTDCMAIVSYGFEQSAAAFTDASVNLHVLAPFDVITEQAHILGYFDAATLETINTWRQAPYEWGKKS
ncbi:MAG: orotate phosphoribosyltransferase [Chloroflexota bacterium]